MEDLPDPATPLRKNIDRGTSSPSGWLNPCHNFVNDVCASARHATFVTIESSTLSVGHAIEEHFPELDTNSVRQIFKRIWNTLTERINNAQYTGDCNFSLREQRDPGRHP
jgi:hypothetical protein